MSILVRRSIMLQLRDDSRNSALQERFLSVERMESERVRENVVVLSVRILQVLDVPLAPIPELFHSAGFSKVKQRFCQNPRIQRHLPQNPRIRSHFSGNFDHSGEDACSHLNYSLQSPRTNRTEMKIAGRDRFAHNLARSSSSEIVQTPSQESCKILS